MYHVTVAFRADREYEFHVHADDIAGLTKDAAREWLQEEFDELECTPSNPVGKVLVLDVILNVAKYGGEQRFAQGGEWAGALWPAWAWPWIARPCVSTCRASWWAKDAARGALFRAVLGRQLGQHQRKRGAADQRHTGDKQHQPGARLLQQRMQVGAKPRQQHEPGKEAQQARHAEQPGPHRQALQTHPATRLKTTSHTPWPSLMPRFSNLVSGR